MTLLNLELKSPDISETTIITSTPPLYSSKGGTAHGEQERNFKLVIRGQKRKEPNGHNSGKTKEIMTTITCLLQRATVWCEQTEVPTVKPAQLKYSRDVLLDNVMRWYTNYLVVGQTGQIGQSLNSRCTKKEMSVTCGFGISFSCAAIHNRFRNVVFVVIVCRIEHTYPAAQEKDLLLNMIGESHLFSQGIFCTLPHVFLQFWHRQKWFFCWQPLQKLI